MNITLQYYNIKIETLGESSRLELQWWGVHRHQLVQLYSPYSLYPFYTLNWVGHDISLFGCTITPGHLIIWCCKNVHLPIYINNILLFISDTRTYHKLKKRHFLMISPYFYYWSVWCSDNVCRMWPVWISAGVSWLRFCGLPHFLHANARIASPWLAFFIILTPSPFFTSSILCHLCKWHSVTYIENCHIFIGETITV